jgi:hypothetical protein
MILSQTLGRARMGAVDLKKARAAIRKIETQNKDIRTAVAAKTKAAKAKTQEGRRQARIRALSRVIRDNPAFRDAVTRALSGL